MTWKDYLNPAEINDLAWLALEKRQMIHERKQIYDRCRQRMRRAGIARLTESE